MKSDLARAIDMLQRGKKIPYALARDLLEEGHDLSLLERAYSGRTYTRRVIVEE